MSERRRWRPKVSDELMAAIETGSLTVEQLRELIQALAEEIGLTFEDAVRRAEEGTLPNNAIGSDLHLLVKLLREAEPIPA
jgi:hypothetical protein